MNTIKVTCAVTIKDVTGVKIITIKPTTGIEYTSLKNLMTIICTSLIEGNVTAVRLPVSYADVDGITMVDMPADIVTSRCIMSNIYVLPIKETIIKEEVKVKEFTEEQTMDALEKELDKFINMTESATKHIVRTGIKEDIKQLLEAKDCDVYQVLLNRLSTMKVRQAILLKRDESTKSNEIKETLKAAVESLNPSPTVMDKIKALIAYVVKKTIALLKGTLAFAFDATTILGTMVGRVVYHTAKELFYAGQAIGTAFKVDIIDTIKNA